VVRRALVSVSNKEGVVEFARQLSNAGFELVSTGGTSKVLKEAGFSVIDIDSVTGFPEILGGRVKTLHPMVHGGLLANLDLEEHVKVLKEHNITPIELVCVNLYPFQETISKDDVSVEDAIENIDIGGPTMLRAAAKNHAHVTVVVDPQDYDKIGKMLQNGGAVDANTRRKLAAKVFRHTASYDALISQYLTNLTGESSPKSLL